MLLADCLVGAVRGVIDPEQALLRLRNSTPPGARYRHANYLLGAWRFIQRTPESGSHSPGGGRGGYRAIRGGWPPGRYAIEKPVPLNELGDGWAAGEAWDSDSDGTGRGGDAPAEAATPGEVDFPDSREIDDFAVPYYSRAQAYAARRRQHQRRTSAAQDTVITATNLTPCEAANVTKTLLDLIYGPDDNPELRKGAAQALIGLLTRIAESRAGHRDRGGPNRPQRIRPHLHGHKSRWLHGLAARCPH
jgi:hypothetical protein